MLAAVAILAAVPQLGRGDRRRDRHRTLDSRAVLRILGSTGGEPVPDRRAATRCSPSSWRGGIAARLPFRNSSLELTTPTRRASTTPTTSRRAARRSGGFGWRLEFSRGDKLVFQDDFRRDFSIVDIVESAPEQVFTGEPYDVNRWSISAEREIAKRQGYLIRVSRSRLQLRRAPSTWATTTIAGSTVPSNTATLSAVRAGGRCNTENDAITTTGPRRDEPTNSAAPVPAAIFFDRGVPFQKEQNSSFRVGLRGSVGRGRNYGLLAGVARFRLKRFDPATGGLLDRRVFRSRATGMRNSVRDPRSTSRSVERCSRPRSAPTSPTTTCRRTLALAISRSADLDIYSRLVRVDYGEEVFLSANCGLLKSQGSAERDRVDVDLEHSSARRATLGSHARATEFELCGQRVQSDGISGRSGPGLVLTWRAPRGPGPRCCGAFALAVAVSAAPAGDDVELRVSLPAGVPAEVAVAPENGRIRLDFRPAANCRWTWRRRPGGS